MDEPPAAATPARGFESGGAAQGGLLTPLDAASAFSDDQPAVGSTPGAAGLGGGGAAAAPAAPHQQATDSSSMAESSLCSLDREYASASPERASSPDVSACVRT